MMRFESLSRLLVCKKNPNAPSASFFPLALILFSFLRASSNFDLAEQHDAGATRRRAHAKRRICTAQCACHAQQHGEV
jgi:hypothetical protein